MLPLAIKITGEQTNPSLETIIVCCCAFLIGDMHTYTRHHYGKQSDDGEVEVAITLFRCSGSYHLESSSRAMQLTFYMCVV